MVNHVKPHSQTIKNKHYHENLKVSPKVSLDQQRPYVSGLLTVINTVVCCCLNQLKPSIFS